MGRRGGIRVGDTALAAPRFTASGVEPGPAGTLGAMSDPVSDAVVRQMRDAIIDNDLHLMAAVNRRLELVARLRAYKEAHGMEFIDGAREEWMHRYLQGANAGPLSAAGLSELYGHVLDLTKAETGREADGSVDGSPRGEAPASTRS
jgi:chorismate mutase